MAQGAPDAFAKLLLSGNSAHVIVEALGQDMVGNSRETPALPLDDNEISEIQSTISSLGRAPAFNVPSYRDNQSTEYDAPPITYPADDESRRAASPDKARRHDAQRLGAPPLRPPFTQSDSGLSEITQLTFCSIETVIDRGSSVQMEWEQEQPQIHHPTSSSHSTPKHSRQGTPDSTEMRPEDNVVEPLGSSTHINGATTESVNHSEDGDFEDVSSVHERICASLVRSVFNGTEYLPLDQLCEILSHSVVRQLLSQHFTKAKVSEYEREVLGTQPRDGSPPLRARRRRILAILISINQVQRLAKFVEDGVDDTALPFHLAPIEKSPSGKPLAKRRVLYMPHQPDETCQLDDCPCRDQNQADQPIFREFDVWPNTTATNFTHWQNIIHVPFFKFLGKNIYFYDLHQDSVLPFSEYKMQKTGGYGSVRKVTIHHSHHDRGNPKDKKPVCLAVKKPHVPSVDDYRQEVDTFDKIGKENLVLNHLIPLQLTFRHGRHYYMMFPWADGNLKQFWKEKENRPWDRNQVRWFMAQCMGIVRGLRKIHHLSTRLSRETVNADNAQRKILDGKEWGRHGDIKPENILWFKDYEGRLNHLFISDFGLTQFNSAHSRSKVNQHQVLGYSGTYRPPDLDVEDQQISQSYDIWSLGCVLLEFLSWLLLGYEETIKHFSQERVNDEPEGNMKEDTFFAFEKSSHDTSMKASLKKSVVQWIGKLHDAPHCSEPLHALLDLIQFTMLMPDSKDRWRCCLMYPQLKELKEMCNASTFDTKRTPGGSDPDRYPQPTETPQTPCLPPRDESQKDGAVTPSQGEAKESTQSMGSSSTRKNTTVNEPPLTGVPSSIQEGLDKEARSNHMDDTRNGVSGSQPLRTSTSASDRTARKSEDADNQQAMPSPTQESTRRQVNSSGSQFDGILQLPDQYRPNLADDTTLDETTTIDTNIQGTIDDGPEPQPGSYGHSSRSQGADVRPGSSVGTEPQPAEAPGLQLVEAHSQLQVETPGQQLPEDGAQAEPELCPESSIRTGPPPVTASGPRPVETADQQPVKTPSHRPVEAPSPQQIAESVNDALRGATSATPHLQPVEPPGQQPVIALGSAEGDAQTEPELRPESSARMGPPPVEAFNQQAAKAPSPQPVETPIQQAVEAPGQQLAGGDGQIEPELGLEFPVRTEPPPAGPVVQQPADAPNQQPAETSSLRPVKAPDPQPAQTPSRQPVEAPGLARSNGQTGPERPSRRKRARQRLGQWVSRWQAG